MPHFSFDSGRPLQPTSHFPESREPPELASLNRTSRQHCTKGVKILHLNPSTMQPADRIAPSSFTVARDSPAWRPKRAGTPLTREPLNPEQRLQRGVRAIFESNLLAFKYPICGVV